MLIENFNNVIQNKYADFEGRARRSEFWYFVLANVILSILATLIDSMTWGWPILSSLLTVGLLVPSLAVAVRRLHDTNKSGWFLLLALIPFIGGIIIIVFYCLEGTPGPNQYGPDPKGISESMADHLI